MESKIESPFKEIKDHILLPWATEIPVASEIARERLTEGVFEKIVELIPDEWLNAVPGGITPAERRAGYRQFFTRRLDTSARFEGEAIRAHASGV
jgi:hypothetical protein